jgi:hypothetical protein
VIPAREIIRREIPLNSILIPTSVPITHSLPDGHGLKINKARISVTSASNINQTQPVRERIWNDKINSRMPSANK